VTLFGDEPGPELERELVERFRENPRFVAETIEQVGHDVKRGSVHAGWPVARARLRRADDVPDVVADDEAERIRKVALAETWIRNAGLLLDRRDELEDELFGERGRLKPWADDELLRRRLVELWQEQRPTGEQIEREVEERMTHYREIREAGR
jgi:hypothetical protein